MGEHLELQLGIFVEHLQAALDTVAAIFLNEVPVLQQPLEMGAQQVAGAVVKIALEKDAAVGKELNELVSHIVLPGEKSVPRKSIFSRKISRGASRGQNTILRSVQREGIFVSWAGDSSETDAAPGRDKGPCLTDAARLCPLPGMPFVGLPLRDRPNVSDGG